MTHTVNNTTAAYELTSDGRIKLSVNGKVIGTFNAEQMTSIITVSLAGRKAAYGVKREATQKEREAKKAERAVKKQERAAAAAARKVERANKLREQLAKLEGAVTATA